jgi:hypothetical protein
VSERQSGDPINRQAEAEADAAAAEAGAVGGRRNQEADPAEQPLREAGGGEAEGFEQAEEDLREHAEHGDPAPDPSGVEPRPEAESDLETGGARGEPDDFRSSERTGEV